MTMIKHTGYNNKTKRKVVVVFREIPEERESALVVETESLMDRFHDGLMSATESAEGQATDNLYEVLNRRMFFDGEPMLQTLHSKGWLHKVDVSDITLSPAPNKEIPLSEYNKTAEVVEEKDNSKNNELNIEEFCSSFLTLDNRSIFLFISLVMFILNSIFLRFLQIECHKCKYIPLRIKFYLLFFISNSLTYVF